MNATQRQAEDKDTFWRKLVLPQEERMRLGIPWHGGYRWFRSPNVVCLEQWRRKKAQSKRTMPDEGRDPHIQGRPHAMAETPRRAPRWNLEEKLAAFSATGRVLCWSFPAAERCSCRSAWRDETGGFTPDDLVILCRKGNVN